MQLKLRYSTSNLFNATTSNPFKNEAVDKKFIKLNIRYYVHCVIHFAIRFEP